MGPREAQKEPLKSLAVSQTSPPKITTKKQASGSITLKLVKNDVREGAVCFELAQAQLDGRRSVLWTSDEPADETSVASSLSESIADEDRRTKVNSSSVFTRQSPTRAGRGERPRDKSSP